MIFSCFGCFAQVDKYEEYKRKQQEKIDSMKAEQKKSIDRMQKEYEDYVKAEKAAYDKFVKERAEKWGKDNVTESTQTDWVEYSDDGKSRSTVDFENGEATIEIIQEKGEKVDNKELEKRLKFLLTNKGKTKDYDSEVEKARPLQENPVLENQVQTPSGEIVTEKNLDKDVKEIVENMKPEIKTIKGNDNVERQVVTIKLELMPDHIRTRAEQYQHEVRKYCQKWNVDPALVYAVMQTESSFNPKAKSPVPAYGLMQIVPCTAGADCASSLCKPFKTPTGNYLYEPENNIEMGVHYLHLLNKRHFTNVSDKDSQVLCVIASYNTGAGNLSRTLRGDTKIGKAIPQINAMSYEELFRYLEKNLHPETQNYIRKVTERMNNFKTWLK